jgi:phage terminase small subunit
MQANGLTDFQNRFVGEYLKDLNATQAAIRAGYSVRSANHDASSILKGPKVKAVIAARQAVLAARLDISQERILQQYAKVAFASLGDFIKIDKRGKPVIDLALIRDRPEELAALSEVSIIEGKVKIKLKDSVEALTHLARHLGMFKQDESGPKQVIEFVFNPAEIGTVKLAPGSQVQPDRDAKGPASSD